MGISCAVITIGNEILLGRTLNSNLAWLGQKLAALGFDLKEALIVEDDSEAIKSALKRSWQSYDLIITTGGLGPTEDDVSRSAIASFFGKDLVYVPQIWEELEARFAQRGAKPALINRNQAMVPQSFSILENELGTAPGFYFKQDSKLFFALQGVPLEMKHVFDIQVRPILQDEYPEAKGYYERTMHCFGIAESSLAELLHADDLPQGVNLAWLPQTGRVDLKILSDDPHTLAQAESVIEEKAGYYIWGKDQDSPASILTKMLREQNLRIAVAESCTAGLVQAYLAEIPGASEVFLGGVVSYANSIKEEVLGLRQLSDYGAVSSETAIAMAQGVQKLCLSDVALAITGIAGPTGGTEQKPVGTVFFGFCIKDRIWHKKLLLFGDRNSIRHKAAEAAMLLLIKLLMGKEI